MFDPAQEQIRRELWRRGDLWVDLRPHQQAMRTKIDACSKQIHTLHCSRGAGKTTLLLEMLLEHCLKNPGHATLLAIPYQVGYTKTLDRMLDPILENYPEDLHPVWNGTDKTYTFANGSIIFLVGLEAKTAKRIKKLTIHLAVIDEVQDITEDLEYIIDGCIVPAFRRYPGKVIISGTTPKDNTHQFLSVFIPEAIKNNSHSVLTIYDIGWTEEEIARSRRSELNFAREFLCQVSREDAEVIVPEFNKDRHVAEALPTKGDNNPLLRLVGMDWGSGGANDPSAAVFIEYNPIVNNYRVVDEIVFKTQESNLTENIAAEVKKKEIALWGTNKVVRIADNQPKNLINDMTNTYKTHVRAVEKSSLEHMEDKVRRIFKRDDPQQITIDPRCKHLIGSLESGRKENGKWVHSLAFNHFDTLAGMMYAFVWHRGTNSKLDDKISQERPKLDMGKFAMTPNEQPKSTTQQRDWVYKSGETKTKR